MLRVTSANLNGIRSAHSKGFFDWLSSLKPDIVGVQEVKAQADVVEGTFCKADELNGHFHYAQAKGYSGVGLYTREDPSDIVVGLGVPEFDAEGRWIEKRFDKPGRKLSFISCYFPSGSSSEERQQAKFRFLEVVEPHLARLRSEREFILVGDVNIAHKEIDLKNWKGNLRNSGFLPEERAWMTRLLDPTGNTRLVDVYRMLHPDTTDACYTWWSNRGQAYAKNVGWRIDYQIATSGLAQHARSASVYKDTRFSDHAPLTVDYDLSLRTFVAVLASGPDNQTTPVQEGDNIAPSEDRLGYKGEVPLNAALDAPGENRMGRRKPYTELRKVGQVRPDHVQGKGDVLFKHFQCLAPTCKEFITVEVSAIAPDFSISCESCGYEHKSGDATKFFDYELHHKTDAKIIEQGAFSVLHDDYVNEAPLHKYCLLCYALKPVGMFSRHSARESGYQGECQSCKTTYNSIKNQTRTTDQHREAAQRRRLYVQLSQGGGRIESKTIYKKFNGRCFSCDKALAFAEAGKRDFDLDHTLPASLLWPMSTANSTLLCSECNNEKHDAWPSTYYKSKDKLKALSVLTGYPFDLLNGPPQINQDAVTQIIADVDNFLMTWIPYPNDIKKVRRLIKAHTGVDIFDRAANVPQHLREPEELPKADD